MKAESHSNGFVLECEPTGRITAVVFDSLGLADAPVLGLPFAAVVCPTSLHKALNFFAGVVQNHALFDWELNVRVGQETVPMYCAGALERGRVIVVATRSRHDLDWLFSEMQRINNEQVNCIRDLMKRRDAPFPPISRDAVFEDLTRLNSEFATIQRELAKKNAELNQHIEHKNMLLGVAAHDLRSPLCVIVAYADFLEMTATGRLTPKELEMLHNIRESSSFMLRMIDELLVVSKAATGKLALDRNPTNFAALVGANVARNAMLANAKGISLHCEIAPDLPSIAVDEGKLEQVLNNLISNAIKFSDPGTAITVAVSHRRETISVSVTDQGQGIPDSELPKLFLPFSRTSVRSTAREPSTGLGLAICKSIVEGHGGTIGVDSVPGRGSTFTFTLPRTLP